ncbi:Protein of unknown function [Propionibacterium freudenreichii]|nr:Protein of unknown function [Propionibacterium freudenreichii]CEI48633.1 Protein of unknown function [Propionibacterium freudenreichii]
MEVAKPPRKLAIANAEFVGCLGRTGGSLEGPRYRRERD